MNEIEQFLKAVAEGHLDRVKSLLAKNIHINSTDDHGITPLMTASMYGQLAVAEYLLKNHAAVDMKITFDTDHTYAGDTALHLAVRYNHFPLVKLLVLYGANVEDKDALGYTALHMAAEHGCLEITEWLVEICHANLNAEDAKGDKPIYVAAKWRHLALVQYLIKKYDADIIEVYKTASAAVDGGNKEILALLIKEYDLDNSKKDKHGNTFLHIAADKGDFEISEHLIKECDVNVDEKNNDGLTALHLSANCNNNNAKFIKWLVKVSGANVNAKDDHGNTALHFATKRINLQNLQCLVEECEANIDTKNNNGQTALHLAATANNLTFVQYLVERGTANIDEKDKNGQTALHLAARRNALALIQYLVKTCGANVDEIDNNGKTALHIAMSIYLILKEIHFLQQSLEIVKWLVKVAYANVNIKDDQGNTILLAAAKAHSLFIVQWLLVECGAKLMDKNNQDHTIFTYALHSPDLMQMLLRMGAGINLQLDGSYLNVLKSCDLNNCIFIGTRIGDASITRTTDLPHSCNIKSAITNINELRLALSTTPQDKSSIDFVAIRVALKQQLDALDRHAPERNILNHILHTISSLHSLKYRCLKFVVDNKHQSIIKRNLPKLTQDLKTTVVHLTEQSLDPLSRANQNLRNENMGFRKQLQAQEDLINQMRQRNNLQLIHPFHTSLAHANQRLSFLSSVSNSTAGQNMTKRLLEDSTYDKSSHANHSKKGRP